MVKCGGDTTTTAIIAEMCVRGIPSEKGVNRRGKRQKHVIASPMISLRSI